MSSRIDVWDAGAKIRGHMVAGTGSFSGTFASDNVDALSEINIRGGAVSSHLIFTPPVGSRDFTFTVPSFDSEYLVEIHTQLRPWFVGDDLKVTSVDSFSRTTELYFDGALHAREVAYSNQYWYENSAGWIYQVENTIPMQFRFFTTQTAQRQYRINLPAGSAKYIGTRKVDGDTLQDPKYGTSGVEFFTPITVSVWKR